MTAALAAQGVQYGTVTIASGSTTGTGAITAMGTGGFLLRDGEIADQAGTSFAQSSARLSLSGSTITGTRQTGGTNTVTIPFVAIDGDTTNLINSVQFGTVSLNGSSATGTATISAVTTANTAIAHLGANGTATNFSLNLDWVVWSLLSTTSVQMAANTSGGTTTGGFCAIEFKAAALQSLQFVSDTAAPAVATRNHAISAVTLANAFQVYAGQWSSSTPVSSALQYGQLNSTTNLLIGTTSGGSISINYSTFIVELVSGLVETGCQRGLITLTAAATNTASISAVNTAHAILTHNGNSTNGANWNATVTDLILTSGTVVTVNSGVSQTGNTSYEVIALNPAAAAANPNAWYPVYQAQSRPNYRPQADFVFQQIPPYVAPPYPQQPIYNDQVRPNLKVQRDFFFMAPQPLNFAMPWQAEYPNQVPFFMQQEVSGAVEPILAINTPLRWLPQYIDLPRPVIQPFKNFFFAPPFPLNLNMPWQAEYPNQVPFFNQQLPSGIVDVPIFPLNFPMPWLPQYADQKRPNLPVQRDFVFLPPFAIITPQMDMPWLPHYPDMPPPNLKVQRDFVFGPTLALNNPLPWLPNYPDQARKPAPVRGPSLFSPIPALTLPLPWLPTYPDTVRLRLNVQNTNQLFNIQTIVASVRFAYWISFDGL